MELRLDKYCPGCQATKHIDEFNLNRARPDRRQDYCRICQRTRAAADRARAMPSELQDDAQCVEDAFWDSESDIRQGGDYLYVCGNSRLPDLKIGRSINPYARARDLQSAQPFTVRVIALVPRAGHLETRVHQLLDSKRVQNAAGKEWFACSAQEALNAVALVLATDVD